MTVMSADRRNSPRYDVELESSVEVALSRVVDERVNFSGHVCNISRTGMRIRVFEISTDSYLKIVRGPRFARIQTKFPGTSDQAQLIGRILNFDYRSEQANGSCYFGINFSENDPSELEKFYEFHRRIESESSAT